MFGVIIKTVVRHCAVFLLLACLCAGKEVGGSVAVGNREIPSVRAKGGSAILDQWLVVGPFQGGGVAELLAQDPIALQMRSQSDAKGEPVHVRDYIIRNAASRDLRRVQAEIVDLTDLYAQPNQPYLWPAASYLVCNIENDTPRTAYLMFSNVDWFKVWLNGKEILVQPKQRRFYTYTYTDVIKVDLLAGENHLCLKAVGGDISWSVTARLAGTAAEATEVALNGQGIFTSQLLAECLVATGEPVVFLPLGVPEDARLACTVRDFAKTWEKHGELIGRKAAFPGSEKLPVGLYWAEVVAGGHTYTQPFVVGPSAAVASGIIQQADALTLDEAGRLNVEALERRIHFFLQPKKLSQEQERTFVYSLTELANVLIAANAKREAFKGASGLHVRAFKSKIDDQTQYYRLFVPTSHKVGEKLPLVVFLPTSVSSIKPFVESSLMNAHDKAERLSVLAEKYGLAVLWCGYRKAVRADPIEFTHVDETINAVEKDYEIDENRITLMGACSAGVQAMGLLAREPGKFAAVALLTPAFTEPKTTTPEIVRACYANTTFLKWVLKDNAIQDFMDRSTTPPVLLVHDRAEPGHGDLEASVKFTELGKSRGKAVELEQMQQTLLQHFGAWDRLLAWVSQAQRTGSDAAVFSPQKSINEFFTQRFTVVVAKGGAVEDQQAVVRIRDQFVATWRVNMFGDCRCSDEDRLSIQGKADENLVLIGNERTSALWAQLAQQAGIRVEADKVKIGDRVWLGENLSIQVRVDDPKASGRSIIFVGGSNLSKVKPGTMNLALDGWYQYAIWDTQGKLVDAGML